MPCDLGKGLVAVGLRKYGQALEETPASVSWMFPSYLECWCVGVAEGNLLGFCGVYNGIYDCVGAGFICDFELNYSQVDRCWI